MPRITTIEKRDGVAIIWLDDPNEKINKVSVDFMNEVDEIFRQLENDAEVKASVIISKKKDFIAGADIEMFKKYRKGRLRAHYPQGMSSLNKLAQSPKPVVAAINGTHVWVPEQKLPWPVMVALPAMIAPPILRFPKLC